MSYSVIALQQIREGLIGAIERLKTENEGLENKLENYVETVYKEDNSDFLQELKYTECVNGLSFKNTKKEMLDNCVCVSADIVVGNEELHIKVTSEASTHEVKTISLTWGDTSCLSEIKVALLKLVEDLHISLILQALVSFSIMKDLRSEIIEDLLQSSHHFFKVESREIDDSTVTDGPASKHIFITAFNGIRHTEFFEVEWSLSWNYGKLSIQHKFSITELQDMNKVPRVVPLLRQLNNSCFVGGTDSELINLWRDIAKEVADF